MSINDGQGDLATLFNDNIISVPSFQRAYSWEKSHLRSFVDDIKNQPTEENKAYFLGTILLSIDPGMSLPFYTSYLVVDGQQRLTTICIFVAVAISKIQSDPRHADRADKFYKRFLQDSETRKFYTIKEDEGFFKHLVIKGSDSGGGFVTPSQRRIYEAKEYFETSLKDYSNDDIINLLSTLWNAKVLVYAVRSNAEATQIFEFQNDRGKRLTNLEALKSFLMHGLYVHAGNSTESDLNIVQQSFSHVYRNVERLEAFYGAPDEDSLLSYHCLAYEQWRTLEDNSEGWSNPKELVRSILNAQIDKAGWITEFASRLKDSYEVVCQILQARDNNSCPSLGDLWIMGRVAPFWPLLVKSWNKDTKNDKPDFDRTVRLMVSFACRSIVAGKRSDAGVSELRIHARDFNGDFDDLCAKLDNMRQGWDIPKFFELQLNSENVYDWGMITT